MSCLSAENNVKFNSICKNEMKRMIIAYIAREIDQ